MEYKAVIFDLDGVICSTDRFHYMAWKHVADKLGIHFDEKINNRLRGVSRMYSLEILLEKQNKILSREEKQALTEEKNKLYRELLRQMSKKDLSTEVKSTLDTLREEGLLLAIGSSSQNARFILERLGLEHYFDVVSDGTDISRSKPDPEVFQKAAELLGLAPGQCLVVEDAEAGIQAAYNGGFQSAGIGDAAKSKLVKYELKRFADLLWI